MSSGSLESVCKQCVDLRGQAVEACEQDPLRRVQSPGPHCSDHCCAEHRFVDPVFLGKPLAVARHGGSEYALVAAACSGNALIDWNPPLVEALPGIARMA